MDTDITADMISSKGDPELIAAYVAMMPKVRGFEDLLCLTVCAVTEQVVRNAKRAGADRPNADAVMTAATAHVLADWQAEQPRLWQGYLRETGLGLHLLDEQG